MAWRVEIDLTAVRDLGKLDWGRLCSLHRPPHSTANCEAVAVVLVVATGQSDFRRLVPLRLRSNRLSASPADPANTHTASLTSAGFVTTNRSRQRVDWRTYQLTEVDSGTPLAGG